MGVRRHPWWPDEYLPHGGADKPPLLRGPGIDKLAVSNDGVNWDQRVIRELHGHDWTLTPGLGLKTVYLRWHEAGADRWSPSVSDSIELVEPPIVPPTVTAPTVRLLSGTGIEAGRAQVQVAWTGSGGSGDALRFRT